MWNVRIEIIQDILHFQEIKTSEGITFSQACRQTGSSTPKIPWHQELREVKRK